MILVDGLSQDTVSIQDRAIHYGDGIFETIAATEGVPLAWDLHLERFYLSCQRLDLQQPDASVLLEEIKRVCADKKRAVVKIILSRGEAGRGYSPAPGVKNRRIVAAYEWPEYPVEYAASGISCSISKIRLGHNPVLAGIKHLNRLEQVLVARELQRSDFPEMVVLDIDEAVTEGSKSNIFMVKEGMLITPRLDLAGVEGVVRQAILHQAEQLKLETRVERLGVDDLLKADEIFFCNSIIGIWPVKQFNAKEFDVGPISQQIRKSLYAKNLIIQQ